MQFFEAKQNKNKIIISSNTNWSCKVVGNCLLSKCNGVGNDEITIIIPKELASCSGQITFTYGDERCNYPVIEVFFVNNCFIKTIPSFSTCEEGNVLVVPFYRKGEMLTITVLSNGIWSVTKRINCSATAYSDRLVIYTTEKLDGLVEISPNLGCQYNFVRIKLVYSGD